MNRFLRVLVTTAFVAVAMAASPSSSLFAQKIYVGGSNPPDTNWNDPTNWQGGVAPVNGDDLIFQSGINQNTTTINNIPGLGLSTINSITFSNITTLNFTLTGNALTLGSAAAEQIVLENDSATLQQVSLNGITLHAGAVDKYFNAASGDLTVTSPIALNGSALGITGSHTTTISGPISGAESGGGLTASLFVGDGTTDGHLVLSGSSVSTIGAADGGVGVAIFGGSLMVDNTSGNPLGALGAAPLLISGTVGHPVTLGTDLVGGTTIGNAITVNSDFTAVPTGQLNLSGAVTLTTPGGTTTITNNTAGTVDGNGAPNGNFVNFSGAIGGANNLTLAGGGMFEFSGNPINNYTGLTTVTGGTLLALNNGGFNHAVPGNLQIDANSIVRDLQGEELNTTSTVTINGNGLLDLNNSSETIGSLNSSSSTSQVTLGGGILTVGNGNGGSNFAGGISGSGQLTKVGTGTVVLTGTNTYSGNTNIQNGAVQIGNGGSLNAVTNVILGAAAGPTFGVFVLGDGNGAVSQTVASLTTASNDGALDVFNAVIGGNTLNGTASNLTVNNSTSDTYDGSIGSIFAGPSVANNLHLTKTGSGTLYLETAGNNYTGGTSFAGGTMEIGTGATTGINNTAATSLAIHPYGAGLVTVDAATTLTTDNLNAYTLANNFQLNPPLTVNVAGLPLTLTGNIFGTDGLTKTGVGTLILTGTNTYGTGAFLEDGNTNVQGGTLQAGSTLALSHNSAFVLSGGSTVDLNGFSNTIKSLASADPTTLVTNTKAGTYTTLTVGNASVVDPGGPFVTPVVKTVYNTTYAGKIQDLYTNPTAGALGLTLDGLAGSSLTLTGTANTYGGDTTINSGNELIGAATGALSFNSNYIVNGGATLDVTAGNTVATLTGAGTVTNDAGTNTVLTIAATGGSTGIGGDNVPAIIKANSAFYGFNPTSSTTRLNTTFNGQLTDGTANGGSGVLGLTIAGPTGTTVTLTPTGLANNYTGLTTIAGGNKLIAGNSSAFSANSGFVVNSGGTVDLNGNSNTILSLSGGSSGSVTNNGGAEATLTIDNQNQTSFPPSYGTNTFAGNLTDGSSKLDVTLQNSAVITLTGNNTYSGATSVTNSEIFAGSTTALSSKSAYTLTNGFINLSGNSNTIASLNGDSNSAIASGSGGGGSGNAVLTIDATPVATKTMAFNGTLQDSFGTPGKLGLTVQGGAILTLGSAFNSYSGATTVASGAEIIANASGALSSNSDFNVNGMLDLQGNTNTIGSLSGGSTGVVTNTTGGPATLFLLANQNATVFNNQSTTVTNQLTTSYGGRITDNGSANALGLTLEFAPGTILTLTNDSSVNPGQATDYHGLTTVFSNEEIVANGNQALSAHSQYRLDGTLVVNKNNTIGSLSDFSVGGGLVTTTSNSLVTLTTGNDGLNSTYTGVISGASLALTKIGGGTFYITGTNTYGGGTNLAGGTVEIGNSQALGTGLVTVSAATTLESDGLHAYNIANNFDLLPPLTVLVNSGPALTMSGNIFGTDGLTKTGAGMLILAGTNTYSGPTIITDGTIQAGTGSGTNTAFSATSNYTLSNADSVLDLNGNNETIASLIGANGLVTNNGATAVTLTTNGTNNASTPYNGAIQDGSAALALTKAGTGILTLGGFNTYSGETHLTGGTLKAASGLAFSGNSAFVLDDGTTLDVGGFPNTIGSLASSTTGTPSTSIVTNSGVNAAILSTNLNGTSTEYDGTVQNGVSALGLKKVGAGTLTLTGNNTYSNGTFFGTSGDAVGVHAGTIAIGSNTALGTGAVTDFDQLSTLTTSNAVNAGPFSVANTISITGQSKNLTVQVGAETNAPDLTLTGIISGTGSMTKTGTGTLTLTAQSTYDGTGSGTAFGTVFNGGTVAVGSSSTLNVGGTIVSGPLGVGDVDVASATILTTDGGAAAIAGLTIANNFTLAPALTVNVNVPQMTLSGVISGADSPALIVNANGDTGTLILTGTNTYTGETDIQAGTLQLGTSTFLNTQVGSLSGSTMVVLGNSNTNTSGLFILGDATNAQNQTISGLLAVGTGVTNAVEGGNVNNISTLTVNYTNTLANDFYSGSLGSGTSGASAANNLALVKTGAGLLALTGTDTYTGGTTVNAGTLAAGSSTALGTSFVTVNSGGTLESTSSIGGSFRSINVGGAYTQNTGGSLVLYGAGPAGTSNPGVAGTNYDTLAVTGTSSLLSGSAMQLNLNGGGSIGQRYIVMTSMGGTVTVNGVDPDSTLGATVVPVTTNTAFKVATAYNDAATLATLAPGTQGVVTATLLPVSFASYQPLTPNQTSVAINIDQYDAVQGFTTGDFADNVVANLAATTYGTPNYLGRALDELSPQRLEILHNIAINDYTYTVQRLDNYLANERDGVYGLDTSGIALNDKALSPSLSQVRNRLLAWSPAPTPGLLSDVSNPMLGGVEMSDAKDMKDMKEVPSAPERPEKKWGAFISGDIALGDVSHNEDVSHSNYTSGGVTAGVDYKVATNLRVGVLFGYSHTDADMDNEGSKAHVDSYTPGIYTAFSDKDGWFLNNLFTYSNNNYSTDRNIIFAGLNRTAHGSTSGNEFGHNIDGGHEFRVGDWVLAPTLGLTYVNLGIDHFDESGAGAASLNIHNESTDSLRSRLGGSVRYQGQIGSVILAPHFSAFWQHEFLNNSQLFTSAFQEPGMGTFSITTQSPDRDTALLGFGLDADINETVTLFLDYQAQVGASDFFGQSGQGGVKLAF